MLSKSLLISTKNTRSSQLIQPNSFTQHSDYYAVLIHIYDLQFYEIFHLQTIIPNTKYYHYTFCNYKYIQISLFQILSVINVRAYLKSSKYATSRAYNNMIEKLIILRSDKEHSMNYNARKRMKIYDHWEHLF